MLEKIDLTRNVTKAAYKKARDRLELELGALQRRARALGVPVAIVFEGWDAAGKGTLINDLILPLDPRGFKVHTTLPPNEEESLRPFLWRFWTRTPARGRMAIFDRSWYGRVLGDRVDGLVKGKRLLQSLEDIRSFERQLADDGCVIIKFFLHISRGEQKKRFDKLRGNAATAWRVTREDLRRRKRHKQYLAAYEEMLAETDSEIAPWTIVESTHRRFASLKVCDTVARRLRECVESLEAAAKSAARRKRPAKAAGAEPAPDDLAGCVLDTIDLSATLTRPEYRRRLKAAQKRLRRLEHEIYVRRMPVVIVFEGWDAAGKGGNIRRLTGNLDPRGYEVAPIAAPNDTEKAHHYLWRFWMQLPKAGHIAIFDRSWYGRVLVERVEGFCSQPEWKRAFREINETEQHLTNFGCVLLKFWLHIDRAEQLRRFRERQKLAYKRWKITEEDWRNRAKWDDYRPAVEELLFRTSTPHAPWTIVESNCKWFARVKTIESVCEAIEAAMDQRRPKR